MKRIVTLLMACALLLTVFAGCGASQTASSTSAAVSAAPTDASTSAPTEAQKAPTELKVWLPPEGTSDTLDKDFWDSTFKTFGEQNNATVSMEITPWDNYQQKYLTAISSGNGPDVGYLYYPLISDYVKMGALEPMDSYLSDTEKQNYLYLDKGVIDGKQYGMPFIVGNPRILYANMDILKKSGFTAPPKTWDDLVNMSKKIQKDSPGIYPFLQEWGDTSVGAMNEVFYPYLWQAGGDLFSSDGKTVTFNDAAGLKAAQFLYDLKFKDKILPDVVTSLKGDDVENDMLQGKAAMAVMGSSAAAELDKKGINWDYSTSLTETAGGTFFAVDCLVMIGKSTHKDLAAAAIKYMTSGPVMSTFHSKVVMYPPIGKDEQYADNPKLKAMYDNDGKYFHILLPVSGSTQVYSTLYKNLQLMMLGQLTPQKALDNTATFAQTVLGK